jgi:hypothetical protein
VQDMVQGMQGSTGTGSMGPMVIDWLCT